MSTPASSSLLWLSGVFMLAVVVAGYAIALRAGHWPPSHPWSGLTLLLLAVAQCVSSSRPDQPSRGLQIWAVVLAVGSAMLWLMATVSARR